MAQNRLAGRIAEQVWMKITPSIDASIDLAVRRHVEEYLSEFLSGCMETEGTPNLDEDRPIEYEVSPNGEPMAYGKAFNVGALETSEPSCSEWLEEPVELTAEEKIRRTHKYERGQWVLVGEELAEDPVELTAEDHVELFMQNYYDFTGSDDDVISAEKMYQTYCTVSQLALSKGKLGYLLTNHLGLAKRKMHGNIHYVGIRLKE